MSIFEEVKQSVTTRQAAERYGVRVGRETSLQKQNHVDYLLDTLLSPDMENGWHIHAQFYRVICVK